MNRETTIGPLLILFILLSTPVLRADFSGPVPGLADTIYAVLDDCSDRFEACIDIPTSALGDYQILLDGGAYAAGIQGCDFDTLNKYPYFVLPGAGSLGSYVLQAWSVGGATFAASFNTMSELVDSMNVWDPSGNWTLDGINFIILGGDPATTYSDMQIWHPTNPTPTTLFREDAPVAQGSLLNFAYGSHQLILRHINTGVSDTSQLYVSCTETASHDFNLFYGVSDTFCLDFSELLFPVQTVLNDCADPTGVVDFSFTPGDSCVVFAGLGGGSQTACIIACDLIGVCDTTYINVTSAFDYKVGSRDVYDNLTEGQTKQYCINLGVFGGSLVDSIRNICPMSSGVLMEVAIDSSTFCVDFTGIGSLGNEEACIVVCDTAGICDTTTYHFYISAPGSIVVEDTILRYASEYFCDLYTANQQTAPFSLINVCPDGGMEKVEFVVDELGRCVDYEGLDIGLGEACIVLEDSLGNVDTTFLKIWVKVPSPELEEINLIEGDSMTWCIDTLELAGRLERIVNDSCGTGMATFEMDKETLCLKIVALEAGQDSACFIFCDQFNLCDTIFWRVNIDPKVYEKPTAEDDFASVVVGDSVEIYFCDNDLFPAGDWTRLGLLSTTSNDSIRLDAENCLLVYTSIANNCGITEELMYEVCNGNACDTARISIDLLCETPPLVFYNGFSPNGDNKNDYFLIEGAENLTNNRLQVYNRWGLLVFQANNYQNDWSGTWKAQNLPDGVYFYLFDDGAGKQYTGSLVINR